MTPAARKLQHFPKNTNPTPRRKPADVFGPLLEPEGPVITEPALVTTAFTTGGAIEITASTVRVIFWEESADLGGCAEQERRIVAKIAMSKRTAEQFFNLFANLN
jgi:hypothetical protein